MYQKVPEDGKTSGFCLHLGPQLSLLQDRIFIGLYKAVKCPATPIAFGLIDLHVGTLSCGLMLCTITL